MSLAVTTVRFAQAKPVTGIRELAMIDFIIQNEGTIVSFHPVSRAAKA